MKRDGKTRADIKPGMLVNIILKKDQGTGVLTEGVVKNILTSAPYHHRGIKVRLDDGQIGRVAEILPDEDF
ncbi:MAG: YwbE family protein [Leadbetterella sp.]|nr:YwbE family protein [Leadbetterella sp.]